MDDKRLKEVLGKNVLFARNSPENKLRVVSTLKEMGHVVAVTGDGVNDAPALKKADIGIAMGITGTDVSKEASSMILADDNFASIVKAVKEGRSVYDSIKKFLVYLLSSNMGEVIAVFFAMLLGLPLILTAIQILWINLVTDLAPALALSVDPPDPDIMNKKPRDPKKRIIDKKMFTRIMLIGLLLGFGTIVAFEWQLGLGASLIKAQTMAFTVIVLYQFVNVFNSRSEDKSLFKVGVLSNMWLIFAVLISFLLQAAVIHIGFLQELFGTTALSPVEWVIAFAIALTVLALDEIRKIVMK
jgi:Ca2+-transporting ATPase